VRRPAGRRRRVVIEALHYRPSLSAITTTIRQHLFVIAQLLAVRICRECWAYPMDQSLNTSFASRVGRWMPAPMRRFVRKQDGSAAVEFGMVAAPFLALVFAIMETAIVFFSGQALETAVADASRLIMTGQAQSQGFTQAAFKNAVCQKVYGLFDCQGGVYIDVKTYSSFSNVNLTPPLDGDGNFQNNFGYQPGGPGDIVVVRLFYQWPIYVSLLQNMSGNKRLLIAMAAFRNEPYQ
jgi:Flp pilus assembly protein TadG